MQKMLSSHQEDYQLEDAKIDCHLPKMFSFLIFCMIVDPGCLLPKTSFENLNNNLFYSTSSEFCYQASFVIICYWSS